MKVQLRGRLIWAGVDGDGTGLRASLALRNVEGDGNRLLHLLDVAMASDLPVTVTVEVPEAVVGAAAREVWEGLPAELRETVGVAR